MKHEIEYDTAGTVKRLSVRKTYMAGGSCLAIGILLILVVVMGPGKSALAGIGLTLGGLAFSAFGLYLLLDKNTFVVENGKLGVITGSFRKAQTLSFEISDIKSVKQDSVFQRGSYGSDNSLYTISVTLHNGAGYELVKIIGDKDAASSVMRFLTERTGVKEEIGLIKGLTF